MTMRLLFLISIIICGFLSFSNAGIRHSTIGNAIVKDDSITVTKNDYSVVVDDSFHLVINFSNDSIRHRILDTSRSFFKLETKNGFEIVFGNKDSNRIIPARATLIYPVDVTARPRSTNGKLVLLRIPEDEISIEGIARNTAYGAEVVSDKGSFLLYSLPAWEEKIIGRKLAVTGRRTINPKSLGSDGQKIEGTEIPRLLLVNPIWILK